ncbi:MAG: SgcJ/EcaC family oxidoreductase [Acidobacteriota bacterium]
MKRSSTSIKLLTTFAAFMLCVFTVLAQGARATTTCAEDEAAIRENVRQMEAGWNTKQGALFAKPFAPDADYVVINGMYFQGRDAIEKAHQQIFNTVFKNTTVRLSIKQIRFLRLDVAVVHVTGHRDAPENERELVSDAFMTMVMTRDKEGWKIAAFQNTQIIANPQR